METFWKFFIVLRVFSMKNIHFKNKFVDLHRVQVTPVYV